MPSVTFHNADVLFKMARKHEIKYFIPYLFSEENISFRAINIIFCSDNYLLTINKEFLNHNYFTDIITFDLSHIGKQVSELYISIDRVRENSVKQKNSIQSEVTRVILHGILHLCGYQDKTKQDKIIMTQKEDKYLALFESFHVKQKEN